MIVQFVLGNKKVAKAILFLAAFGIDYHHRTRPVKLLYGEIPVTMRYWLENLHCKLYESEIPGFFKTIKEHLECLDSVFCAQILQIGS